MAVEYSLDPADIASARLLAIGVRPRLEFALFTVCLAALLAWSVSPWTFSMLPLLIGLTASLGGFRLMQIAKVRQSAQAAYDRNPTLRRRTSAGWDERGVTIQPSGSSAELITWTSLQRLRENDRIVLLLQKSGQFHAIPKRAFPDKTQLGALRLLARRLAITRPRLR
jgi:hypothetical protein